MASNANYIIGPSAFTDGEFIVSDKRSGQTVAVITDRAFAAWLMGQIVGRADVEGANKAAARKAVAS